MRPARPEFSSGPCAKRPGWNPDNLSNAVLGRSHRSKLGKARLKEAIDRTRAVLEVPDDYLIGIVPGSDTGRGGDGHVVDAGRRGRCSSWPSRASARTGRPTSVKQLKLRRRGAGRALRRAARPDQGATGDADLVFTWNGTTSGVRVPNADFIAADREGIDHLRRHQRLLRPGARLGQARCGDLLLAEGAGRRGGARRADPRRPARWSGWRATRPPWPMPKLFRMTKGGKLNADIFEGATINTPSMLCVEDAIDALKWARVDRRPGGACSAAPTPTSRCWTLGGEDAVGRSSWPRNRRSAPTPASA